MKKIKEFTYYLVYLEASLTMRSDLAERLTRRELSEEQEVVMKEIIAYLDQQSDFYFYAATSQH